MDTAATTRLRATTHRSGHDAVPSTAMYSELTMEKEPLLSSSRDSVMLTSPATHAMALPYLDQCFAQRLACARE